MIQIIYPTKYIIKLEILKANISDFALKNIFKSKHLSKKSSYLQKYLQRGNNIIGMTNVAVTRLKKFEKTIHKKTKTLLIVLLIIK